MNPILEVLTSFTDPQTILFVFIGAVAGLFVGAIPGLSVSMATALLVSITYTWSAKNAMATIMGIYVVGVFSGALSAILLNIPGAPSSVVTSLDGYPLAKRGEAHKALTYATWYSFFGSVFGLIMLFLLAKPITGLALKFTPMDYFLLAFFGLATVGSLTAKNFVKGLMSAVVGLTLSMIGLDSVMGTPRMTFGVYDLQTGISLIPALIGLFGMSEILTNIAQGDMKAEVNQVVRQKISFKEIIKQGPLAIYYGLIGTFVGALPGAGGPVASFLAYSEGRRLIKNPSREFGDGAVEGIVASEMSNNAVIGGAMIPMLTLAIPGDAVTAIILSVFYIHGLRPGPMFMSDNPDMFYSILGSSLIACVFLLLLGLLVAPRIGRIITIPKRILMPIIAVLSVVGSFAANNRMFDVGVMIFFGILGFLMRKFDYPVAPLTLSLVLGGMMDANFRRAVSLASSQDNTLMALFGRPITLILLVLTILTLLLQTPIFKRFKLRKANHEKA